jgi:hypothetical protein
MCSSIWRDEFFVKRDEFHSHFGKRAVNRLTHLFIFIYYLLLNAVEDFIQETKESPVTISRTFGGHTPNQTSELSWPHASFASFWEALLQTEQIGLQLTTLKLDKIHLMSSIRRPAWKRSDTVLKAQNRVLHSPSIIRLKNPESRANTVVCNKAKGQRRVGSKGPWCRTLQLTKVPNHHPALTQKCHNYG